jgi:hypothetical protein
MLARIPNLKSTTMTPSARTLQDMLGAAIKSPRIGAGMQGPLGGNMLTRTRQGVGGLPGISLA